MAGTHDLLLFVAAGCVVHIVAAAFGLSAVIAASATAFTVLKVLGALYLIYVGVSLLPQFIDADAPNKPLAFLFLGAIFNLNGTPWNLLVAWSAARFGAGFDRKWLAVWLNRCIGGVLVYVGIRIA